MNDPVREARDRLDGVAVLTEVLNGFRKNLVDAGWNEERAEVATLMWWNSQIGGCK